MFHIGRRLSILSLLAIASACLVAGCGKKITITQYPAFYSPDLKNIAVLPFRNASDVKQAGDAFSDHLTRAVMGNGTYKVFSQNDFAALENQRDLMIYAQGGETADVAAKFKTLKDLQAVLVGTVTTYAATSNTRTEQTPQYSYDKKGNPIYMGQTVRQITRNEGNVVASAALVRVRDGATIWASTTPIQGRSAAEGSPPSMDPYAVLNDATAKAVNQLVSEIAVTRVEISLNPKKDFRTATGLYDNKWEYTDKFSANDEKMFIVLRLPPRCDRNRFNVTIVRKEQRQDLAQCEVIWQRNFPECGQGLEFSPKKLAELGGRGEYTAKFYSGPEPVMTHDFKIE